MKMKMKTNTNTTCTQREEREKSERNRENEVNQEKKKREMCRETELIEAKAYGRVFTIKTEFITCLFFIANNLYSQKNFSFCVHCHATAREREHTS